MVVVVLVSLMLGMAFLKLDVASTGADSRGVGGIVAEQLRAARAQAVSTQIPVAVCFPSEGGTKPHSQGFYLRQGTDNPRTVRYQDLSQDFPGGVIFVGSLSASSNTALPDRTGKLGDYNLARWDAAGSPDYTFLFLPSGEVLTNNLPITDGRYTLVACSGLDYTPDSAAAASAEVPIPASHFRLTSAGKPYLVTITPNGDVATHQGFPSWAGTVSQTKSLSRPPAPLNTNRDPVGPGDPVIQDIKVTPTHALPVGLDGVIHEGEHITIKVEANCAPGAEPLFFRMIPSGGALSQDPNEFVRMEWDPEDARWKGEADWVSPPTAVVGDRFQMEVIVQDSEGRQATNADTAVLVFEQRASESFFIVGIQEVYLLKADGTSLERLPTPSMTTHGAAVTPLGLFASDRITAHELGWYDLNLEKVGDIAQGRVPFELVTCLGLGDTILATLEVRPTGRSEIFISRGDGSEETLLYTEPSDEINVIALSEDCDWLAYTTRAPRGDNLYVCQLDRPASSLSTWSLTNTTLVSNDADGWSPPRFTYGASPQLVYVENGVIAVADLSSFPSVTSRFLTSQRCWHPALSPIDPDLIAFVTEPIPGEHMINIASLSTGTIQRTLPQVFGAVGQLNWILY